MFTNYIQSFPETTQLKLLECMRIIETTCPEAQKKTSYGMPTYCLQATLIHLAAYKNHIGCYPGPSVIAHFKEAISCFKNSKGAVQFPLDKPLPEDLIRTMIRFRKNEILAKNNIK